MPAISINQLAGAMGRRNFAELVNYQLNSLSFEQLKSAIDNATSSLPILIRFEIEEIIHNALTEMSNELFWSNNCGMVLHLFTTMVRRHLSERIIHSEEKHLIEIFHLIVLHAAYRAYRNPGLMNHIKQTRSAPHTPENGRKPGMINQDYHA